MSTGLSPSAMIGFQDTDFTMLESAGVKVACIVLFSEGPLLAEADVIVTSMDGTATSVGSENLFIHSHYECLKMWDGYII